MNLLALEFSSPVRSVAVLAAANRTVTGGLAVSSATDAEAKERRPLSLVEEALTKAATQREQIEGIVVGLGPGSYTGVRSAIALAQGWELARKVRVMGLGSADCLAAGAQARGWLGKINVVIDAQRGEVYCAEYEIDAAGFRLVQPLRLLSIDEARRNSSGLVVGPEVDRWFEGGRVLVPEAEALGRLAIGRDDWTRSEKVEPIYLRATSFVKAPPARVLPDEG